MAARVLLFVFFLLHLLLLGRPAFAQTDAKTEASRTDVRKFFDFNAPPPAEILPNPPGRPGLPPSLKIFGPVNRVGSPSSRYGSQDRMGRFSETGGSGGDGTPTAQEQRPDDNDDPGSEDGNQGPGRANPQRASRTLRSPPPPAKGDTPGQRSTNAKGSPAPSAVIPSATTPVGAPSNSDQATPDGNNATVRRGAQREGQKKGVAAASAKAGAERRAEGPNTPAQVSGDAGGLGPAAPPSNVADSTPGGTSSRSASPAPSPGGTATQSERGEAWMPTQAECRQMGQAACENQRVRAQQSATGQGVANNNGASGPVPSSPGAAGSHATGRAPGNANPPGVAAMPGDANGRPGPAASTPNSGNAERGQAGVQAGAGEARMPTQAECQRMGQAACENQRVRAQQGTAQQGAHARSGAPTGASSPSVGNAGPPQSGQLSANSGESRQLPGNVQASGQPVNTNGRPNQGAGTRAGDLSANVPGQPATQAGAQIPSGSAKGSGRSPPPGRSNSPVSQARNSQTAPPSGRPPGEQQGVPGSAGSVPGANPASPTRLVSSNGTRLSNGLPTPAPPGRRSGRDNGAAVSSGSQTTLNGQPSATPASPGNAGASNSRSGSPSGTQDSSAPVRGQFGLGDGRQDSRVQTPGSGAAQSSGGAGSSVGTPGGATSRSGGISGGTGQPNSGASGTTGAPSGSASTTMGSVSTAAGAMLNMTSMSPSARGDFTDTVSSSPAPSSASPTSAPGSTSDQSSFNQGAGEAASSARDPGRADGNGRGESSGNATQAPEGASSGAQAGTNPSASPGQSDQSRSAPADSAQSTSPSQSPQGDASSTQAPPSTSGQPIDGASSSANSQSSNFTSDAANPATGRSPGENASVQQPTPASPGSAAASPSGGGDRPATPATSNPSALSQPTPPAQSPQPTQSTVAAGVQAPPASEASANPPPAQSNPAQQQFSISNALAKVGELNVDKALDQMKAIQSGQLKESDLSAEDRANLNASKAALTDVMNNQARLQQQTEALERVLSEAQTMREQLLKANDRDIALGIRASEGLATIHSLEAAGRLGKLFDVPLGTAIATSFDLAEGLKSAPEFIAKANEQAGALMTEVQSRAANLFGDAGAERAGAGRADSVAAGGDKESPGTMGALRRGFEEIAKPAVETAKFVPERFEEGKTLKELVKPSLVEAKDGIIKTGLDRAGRTVSGIDSGIAAKEAFDAFGRGDVAAAKEKIFEAAVSASGAYSSDVGALSNAINNVRKDFATRQELIELRYRDPMLAQNLRLQTKIQEARRLDLMMRRAVMNGLIVPDASVSYQRPLQ